jgi:hypothetical protein
MREVLLNVSWPFLLTALASVCCSLTFKSLGGEGRGKIFLWTTGAVSAFCMGLLFDWSSSGDTIGLILLTYMQIVAKLVIVLCFCAQLLVIVIQKASVLGFAPERLLIYLLVYILGMAGGLTINSI